MGTFSAAFGVAVQALVVGLVFVYPTQFLDPASRTAYLETWFAPVAGVGGRVLVYGVPVLAAVAGFLLASRVEASVESVLRGFLLGGVVFGVGVTAVNVLVTHPQLRPSLGDALGQVGTFVLLLAIPAVLAALLGRQFTSHERPA